jgi:hypothetical protein
MQHGLLSPCADLDLDLPPIRRPGRDRDCSNRVTSKLAGSLVLNALAIIHPHSLTAGISRIFILYNRPYPSINLSLLVI